MVGLLRMLWIWLTHRRRGRLGLADSGELAGRVMPWDLDVNLHMNNGRYFAMADMGRYDWWLRTGLWRQVRARDWHPVAGDSNARYSGSLLTFQRYRLRTRLLGWNEKWFFAEQRFVRRGRVMCTVLVRYLFMDATGAPRTTAEVLALIGASSASPPLPDYVATWARAQDTLSAVLRAERSPR